MVLVVYRSAVGVLLITFLWSPHQKPVAMEPIKVYKTKVFLVVVVVVVMVVVVMV